MKLDKKTWKAVLTCAFFICGLSFSHWNARKEARRFVCPSVIKHMPNMRTYIVLRPDKKRGIRGYLPRWEIEFYGTAFDELRVSVDVSFFGKIVGCNIPEIERVLDAPESERLKVWNSFSYE